MLFCTIYPNLSSESKFYCSLHLYQSSSFIRLPQVKWASYAFPKCIDSFVPIGNDDLQIPGYSSVRADHSSNMKQRGVLIYYKNFHVSCC